MSRSRHDDTIPTRTEETALAAGGAGPCDHGHAAAPSLRRHISPSMAPVVERGYEPPRALRRSPIFTLRVRRSSAGRSGMLLSWTGPLGPRATRRDHGDRQRLAFDCRYAEPPIGIEPMTYALRECSRALLAGSKAAPASCSQVAAGGDRWLLMAVRGHLGGTRRSPRDPEVVHPCGSQPQGAPRPPNGFQEHPWFTAWRCCYLRC